VEHGKEDGAFDVEAEAAMAEQIMDDVLAAGLLPEALEDQRRTDAGGGDGGELSAGVGGKQEGVLGEASAGGEEGIELSGLLEEVESSEGGEDALFGGSGVPEVLDELEITSWSGGFDAEEHGSLVKRDTMMIG
jgi:hypothetical protein